MNTIEITTQTKKEPSILERINKTEVVYLCIDCEQFPCFGTPNYTQACQYAIENYCTISIYPIGTYTEIY